MSPLRFSVTLETSLAGVDFQLNAPLAVDQQGRSPEPGPIAITAEETDELLLAVIHALEQDGTAARLAAGGERLDIACVARWMKAKDNDANVVEEAIRTHSFWREEYVPNGRIQEEEVRGEIAAKKVFLQGQDNEGCALLVILASRHDTSVRNIEETERFLCYVLDNAAALAEQNQGEGKIRVLFDLTGLKLKNLDAKWLSAIFDLLQSHYPERLAALWFLNAPFIFWGAWRVISPFINPTTRGKIRFVSTTGNCSCLQQTAPLDILPSCYGGSGELTPIEQAVRKDLTDLASMGPEQVEYRRAGFFSRLQLWRRGAANRRLVGKWWLKRWRAWRGAANNRVTRAVGRQIRSGIHTVRTRVLRQRPRSIGQVPFRLVPKKSYRRSFLPHHRAPVAKIVVRVLVAELVILAIARARTIVINSWA